MHKHSPILADGSIMKDLVRLQRSRPLRDPSPSPPSWHSPSPLGVLSKRGENDVMVSSGRRSLCIEDPRNGRGLSGSSPHSYSLPREMVAPSDLSKRNEDIAAVTGRSRKSRVLKSRRVRREESSRGDLGTDLSPGNDEPAQDGNVLVSETKDKRMKQRGMHRGDVYLNKLSEQLHKVRMDSDAIAPSHTPLHEKHTQNEITGEEAEDSVRENWSGLKRIKRSKFRQSRRTRAAMASRDAGTRNEMPVVSEPLARGSTCTKYPMEEGEEKYADQNVTIPRNGCGIPWNWSRIHHRGKSLFDMAGKSFSFGLSDPNLKKGGPFPRGRDVSDMPVMCDHSSSSNKSDAEALPLLTEGFGSQGTTDNACWVHDYSGELGIFADNLLNHEIDTDRDLEATSGDQQKLRGRRTGRDRNLTQKYMPRTFRDLVGQNLVVQALSNAVVKRKVGSLYVFYGPHGTGKTTCARIFARALNCQCLDHPKPCGYCNSCTAHDMGKSRNIKEVAPVSNFDFHCIMNVLDNMIVSQLPSKYRVLIFYGCDTLSPECWSAISNVIARAPRHVVFLLVSSSLNILPHMVISRCQKFFFPKLKDADITYTLQWIAAKEDIEIDRDALKLIACRSDGSLRDAEMTLEQLSLLGQRISVSLVQELVGLISDDKLIGLLDFALSADTVKTVKNLREITEPGIEPLDLMSQLATTITDILAGTCDFAKEGTRRKFFRQQTLPKEDMEKLRQALKTLSEAEKQLQISNDRLTWLTAALLQLAPDRQYMLPSSPADSCLNHSPLVLNSAGGRERPRKGSVEHSAIPITDRGFSTEDSIENLQAGSSSDVYYNGQMEIISTDRQRNGWDGRLAKQTFTDSTELNRMSGRPLSGEVHKEIEEIWLEVLKKIEINGIKEFMHQEGKLISISSGAAPTVQLMFNSNMTESKAENYKAHILQAFEFVLGSPVTIEVKCRPRRDPSAGTNSPLILPGSQDCLLQMYRNPGLMNTNKMQMFGFDDLSKRPPMDTDFFTHAQLVQSYSLGVGTSEIVEIPSFPRDPKGNGHIKNGTQADSVGEAATLLKSSVVSSPEMKSRDQNQSQSLVRSEKPLGHAIQQGEGCRQPNVWPKHKAISIAEKLEQENLRLESRSRSLLCWKKSRGSHPKLSRLKIRTRTRTGQSLLKFVCCGCSLCAESPRK